MKKRVFALLVIVALMICALPAAVTAEGEEVFVVASGVDTARGSGMLIVYTPDFGQTTNTNEWGYEVAVSNGVVISVGTNNTPIPSDGFVLSGHDDDTSDETPDNQMKTFLVENVAVGDYVSFNDTSRMITISDQPIETSIYYSVTKKADAVNATRNADFLVVYTNSGQTTGTNEWGYEVVVEKNTIVSVGGNDSTVPAGEGSFVLSGHGVNVTWLKANAKPGHTVLFDSEKKEVTISFDEFAAFNSISFRIEELNSVWEALKKSASLAAKELTAEDIEEINELYAVIKQDWAAGETDDFVSKYKIINSKIDTAMSMTYESKAVEYRGVWVRPKEKTTDEVEAAVQRLYDKGINTIYIETLYDSTMIYPTSSESEFSQNPSWKGFDQLEAYINACHSRDMELHLWMPVFYVGHGGSTNSHLSLATKHPEWMAVNNLGTNYCPGDSSNFQFVNPAIPDVVECLLNEYEYLFKNYNIDGFELDYIRYYERSAECDFGYDDVTTAAFEAEYGVVPTYDSNASYWKDWVAFRAKYVTDFVEKVRDLIDEVRPTVLLSAAVGPNIENAYNILYQDYSTWLENGWLDILNTMSYGTGFEKDIAEQIKLCGMTTFNVVGLGAFMDELSADDMLEQAAMVNRLGGDGSAFFESNAYLNKCALVSSSLYSTRAITPTLNKKAAMQAQMDYIKSRVDLLVRYGLSEESFDFIYKDLIGELSAALDDDSISSSSLESIVSAIDNIALVDFSVYDTAQQTLTDDLKLLYKITNFYLQLSDRIDVEKNPEENTSQEDISSQDFSSQESSDSELSGESNYILWIVVSAIGVAVIAAVVVLVIKKGSKK